MLDVSLLDGPLVIGVYLLAAAVLVVLVVVRPSDKWTRKAWLLAAGIAGAAGAASGVILIWLLVDLNNADDLSLTFVTRTWVCLGFASIAIAIAGMWRGKWMRVVSSALAVVLFLTTAVMSVNIDFQQYGTVRSLLGLSAFEGTTLPTYTSGDRPAVADWTPAPDQPSTGKVFAVDIPAVESGFAARPANVYLPPAALSDASPALPVVIALSGQPGAPDDPFVMGELQTALDQLAAANRGVAPIVVVPDQLSAPEVNPMCVDSPIGNSQSYLTKDVPEWVRANLPVRGDRASWAIAGFSQGGTCSIQLGAGFPQLFGSIIDASGELAPTLGDDQTTIDTAFGGDASAYEAAKPLSILAANAPYPDSYAYFCVGENDQVFTGFMGQVSAAAKAAGMTVDTGTSPGTAHDWGTGSYCLSTGLQKLQERWPTT